MTRQNKSQKTFRLAQDVLTSLRTLGDALNMTHTDILEDSVRLYSQTHPTSADEGWPLSMTIRAIGRQLINIADELEVRDDG